MVICEAGRFVEVDSWNDSDSDIKASINFLVCTKLRPANPKAQEESLAELIIFLF